MRRGFRRWVKDSPAWAISIGLHLLVVLIATVVYIGHAMKSSDEGQVVINMRHAEDPKIKELDSTPEKKPGELPEDPLEAQNEAAEETAAEEAEGPSSELSDFSSSAADSTGDREDLVLGVAGGRGGGRPIAYGGRRAAGRKQQKALQERPSTEEGLLAALRWLARHQEPDGSWSATRFERNCGRHGFREDCGRNHFTGNEQYDVGVTGLALLAFLGAAHLPSDPQPVLPEAREGAEPSQALGGGRPLYYGEVVKRAILHLARAQSPSGLVGPEVDRAIYNHIVATIALCEAYGLTGVSFLRDHAERAVRFLAAARSPRAGWRYTPQGSDSDASVTGWAVMALRSAETVGIRVERAVYDEVRRWLEAATIEAAVDPRLLKEGLDSEAQRRLLTGYLGAGDAGKLVSVPGVNDHYHYTPASTAIFIMSTVMMERKLTPLSERAVATLLAFPPSSWSPAERGSWRSADSYYWYHATYALFQATEPADERWRRWNEAMKTALLATQNLAEARGTCREGSWEPVDRWSCEGGRVYATAIAALTLEVYYRYPRVLALEKTDRELHLK